MSNLGMEDSGKNEKVIREVIRRVVPKKELERAEKFFRDGFEEPEKEQPDYGFCKILYMVDNQPKECGGKLSQKEIYKPFDNNTPIGGSYRAPVIDSFLECSVCKTRKSF